MKVIRTKRTQAIDELVDMSEMIFIICLRARVRSHFYIQSEMQANEPVIVTVRCLSVNIGMTLTLLSKQMN